LSLDLVERILGSALRLRYVQVALQTLAQFSDALVVAVLLRDHGRNQQHTDER